MSTLENDVEKTAAVCSECGETYVVHVLPDGTIRPLGVTECPCGEGDLSPLE